jgi:hypothetical protein
MRLCSGAGVVSAEIALIDALDQNTRAVVDQCMALIPLADKSLISSLNCIDFQWLADRSSTHWTSGFHDDGTTRSGSTQQFFTADPWSACLLAFLDHTRLPRTCPSAVLYAWPIVHTRLTQLFSTVNPVPVQDQRSSLFPGTAPKKPANERDISMHLWKNYIAMACRVVPSVMAASTASVSGGAVIRCVSPDLSSFSHLSSSPESLLALDRPDSKASSSMTTAAAAAANPMMSPATMYKLLVPLLRCEVRKFILLLTP